MNLSKQISWRRISQSEIRNSAAAEKSESESEGGQKFLPTNPLPFCPPERSVSAARSAAIIRDFAQNRFELRSVIATKLDTESFRLTFKNKRSLTYFCLKSFSVKLAWRKIDLKVPRGISFLPVGMITVRVGFPVFRNLAWLPFCEI